MQRELGVSIGESSLPINAIILEDQDVDRARLERISKKSGLDMNIEFATDLGAFSNLVAAETYDLAFLDYYVDDGDGIDALRVLRATDRHAATPAIMLTTVSDPELVVEAMRLGCSSYLAKDKLSVKSLTDCIGHALEDYARNESELALRRATQAILTGVSSTCEEELRSSTVKIFRVTNFLRACNASGYQPDPKTFDLLDEECSRILQFLEELDSHCRGWSPKTPLH